MRHSITSRISTGTPGSAIEIATHGDDGQAYEDVLRAHDAILAQTGTDSLTRCAIDTYRKQCWGTADPLVPGQRAVPAPAGVEPKPQDSPRPPAKPQATEPKPPSAAEQAAAVIKAVVKPPALQATKTPAPDPVPAAPQMAEASAPSAPPVPKSAPPEGFGICAECGEAVPSNQAKLSNLFMNKTLCKTCMDKSQGVS